MSLAPDPQRRHWGSVHEYQACSTVPEKMDFEDPVYDLPKESILRWVTTASKEDGLWVVREMAKDPRLAKAAVPLLTDLAVQDGSPDAKRDRTFTGASDDEDAVKRDDSRWTNISMATEKTTVTEPLLGDQARMEKVKSQRLALSSVVVPDAEDPNVASPSEKASANLPIVQFGAFRHFCVKEKETHMKIDVLRIGNLDERSVVPFTTADASARAGVSYVETKGSLIFEPGVNYQSIEVPLIVEQYWNPTLEFSVNLRTDGIQNAALGRYLWETRVSVIDDGAFPAKKYKNAILEYVSNRQHGGLSLGKLTNIPKIGLLREYVYLNFANPMVRSGTIKGMLVDQCHNLYFFQGLFLNIYLVDHVLNTDADSESLLIPGDRTMTLWIIFLLTMVPFALLHFLDYYKFEWRVPGISKKSLMCAIMRKFLNYRSDIRKDLSPGTLVLALSRDADQVVDAAYMPVLALAKELSNIFLMLLFQFIAPYVLNKPLRPIMIIPMVVYPLLLAIFIRCRTRTSLDAQENLNDTMDKFITTSDDIVLNYQLIADYDRRTMFVEEFEKRLMSFNNAAKSWAEILCNSNYFAPWLTLLIVGAFTIRGGFLVIHGRMSLGVYLTDVAVLKQAGASWGAIYSLVLKVQGAIPRLERVTTLLNFPIDLPQRMVLNRYRRKTTQKLRKEIFDGNAGKEFGGLPVDLLPIRIVDPSKQVSSRVSMHIHVNKSEVSMRQGKLIYILGPHGEGKSVLLRLLSGVSLPRAGEEDAEPLVFVPSHLRQLHVSSEPLFFEGTLLKNLTVGVRDGDKDGNKERVLKICRRLGLPPFIREYISNDASYIWSVELSQTQRQLLNLARALIANPEFLCIHKPIQVLDEFTTEKVLELLHEFVERKGIEQDPTLFQMRRPRTCVLTSNRKLDPKFAHMIVYKRHSDGITVAKDD